MKKLLAIASLALFVATACTTQNTTAPEEQTAEKSYLSIRFDLGQTTRATANEEAAVASADLVVYKNGTDAPIFYERYANPDVTATPAVIKEDIDLGGNGTFDVYVIANLPANTIAATTTKAALRAIHVSLTNQIGGTGKEFVMSAEHSFTISRPGYYALGCGQTYAANGVDYSIVQSDFKLERLVAKVNIWAKESCTELTINKAYILNASNNSFIAKPATPAVAATPFFVASATNDIRFVNGVTTGTTGARWIGYDANPKVAPDATYVNANLANTVTIAGNYAADPNATFYVFENGYNPAFNTYIVFEGEWKESDNNTMTVYYPVAINATGATSDTIAEKGTNRVQHNTIYNVKVNITGRGSQNPWDDDKLTVLTVDCTVADWAGEVHQEVDWE